jgi:hypothetical protein
MNKEVSTVTLKVILCQSSVCNLFQYVFTGAQPELLSYDKSSRRRYATASSAARSSVSRTFSTVLRAISASLRRILSPRLCAVAAGRAPGAAAVATATPATASTTRCTWPKSRST